jgi:hypothetical protein
MRARAPASEPEPEPEPEPIALGRSHPYVPVPDLPNLEAFVELVCACSDYPCSSQALQQMHTWRTFRDLDRPPMPEQEAADRAAFARARACDQKLAPPSDAPEKVEPRSEPWRCLFATHPDEQPMDRCYPFASECDEKMAALLEAGAYQPDTTACTSAAVAHCFRSTTRGRLTCTQGEAACEAVRALEAPRAKKCRATRTPPGSIRPAGTLRAK